MATTTVTLEIGEDALRQLLDDLNARRVELCNLLDEIDFNIVAVADALRSFGKRETMVFSESSPGTVYIVRLENGKYGCTCPAFVYASGIDADNHCKHIRRVISEGRFAR